MHWLHCNQRSYLSAQPSKLTLLVLVVNTPSWLLWLLLCCKMLFSSIPLYTRMSSSAVTAWVAQYSSKYCRVASCSRFGFRHLWQSVNNHCSLQLRRQVLKLYDARKLTQKMCSLDSWHNMQTFEQCQDCIYALRSAQFGLYWFLGSFKPQLKTTLFLTAYNMTQHSPEPSSTSDPFLWPQCYTNRTLYCIIVL